MATSFFPTTSLIVHVNGEDAIHVLKAIDTHPRELYLRTSDDSPHIGEMRLQVECIIDGTHQNTGHKVILKPDGTWIMSMNTNV
ncbi:MAG TPA: hypothetical protein VF797_22205 [Noviherbaspirillum sp.]